MGSKIFMLNKNEMGSIFEESAYQEVEMFGEQGEAALQYCLENFPKLIPSTEIDSDNPPKFICIKTEAGVTPGSMDILFLDSNAVLNIIETKLYKNREIRRAVLGQAFEYAASIPLEWNTTKIRNEGKRYWQKRGENFEAIVSKEFIGQDGNIEQFWEKVQKNIDAVVIRIIIVADKVPDQLQQVIQFVNMNSDFDIYALEIKLFVDGDGRQILSPRIYGGAERIKGVGQSYKTEWLPEKLKEEIWKIGNDVRCRRFLEMLDVCLSLDAFGGSKRPAFRFLNRENEPCFNFYCNGQIEVNLRPKHYGGEEKMGIFLEQLNKIKIFNYKQTEFGHSTLTNWLLEDLTDGEFKELKEFVKRVYER